MEYLQYKFRCIYRRKQNSEVLNLVINGIPSIHSPEVQSDYETLVLNLVINGIPSIQNRKKCWW